MVKDWDPFAIDFAAIRTLRLVSDVIEFILTEFDLA